MGNSSSMKEEEVQGLQKKVQGKYQEILDAECAQVDSQYCWLPDWHPEPMPLANAYGTEMNGAMMALSYPPEPPYQDPPNAAPLAGMSVLVFADDYGYATNCLKYAPQGRIGRKQIITTPAEKMAEQEDRIKDILKEQWDLVIYAYGINECPSNDADAMNKHQVPIGKILLTICKAIADDSRLAARLAIMSCDTFAEEREIHEEMGVRCITNAWLWGFSNTARMEMTIPVHFIETEWSLPETCMPLLASEIWRECTFGCCGAVRILKTGRYVLRMHRGKEYTTPKHDVKIADNTVVGISGGNGAVAMIIARWVVERAIKQGCQGLRLEMLSRSMKVGDENIPNWKDLQKLCSEHGYEVEQCKGDVGSEAAIYAWVEKHTPNISGFIHSAGVLADTLLGQITWAEFEKVWQPKSRAALSMHFALEKHHNPNLNMFWMFSSVAAWGNMGQLNYSASNSFMDGLARHRRAMGKPGLASQWGAWGEVGMAANLDETIRRRMAQSPMPPFSNVMGIDGTNDLIASGWPWGCVMAVNGQFMAGMLAAQEKDPAGRHSRSTFSGIVTPYPSQVLDSENLYHIYKTCQGLNGHGNPVNTGLMWKAFRAETLDDED